MAAAVDEDGNDIRLAEWVASMTPEELSAANANLRRSLAQAQRSLGLSRDDKDV